MRIENFTVTPAVAAIGERVCVAFTLIRETNEALSGGLYLECGMLGFVQYLRASNWTAQAQEQISEWVSLEPFDDDLATQLATQRAVAEVKWRVGVQRGAQPVDISAPITYINARCSPLINAFSLERAAEGLSDDSGENLLFTAKLSLAETADSSAMGLRLYYQQTGEASEDSFYIDLSGSLSDLLAGVTEDASLIERSFANSADWSFLLVFGDEYESARARYSISEAFANLHLSGASTGGVCMGGFSSAAENDPKFECHYPARFYKGIHGVNIYSTEEVDTGGRWIDGKKIYAKTFVETNAASGKTYDLPIGAEIETAWIDCTASFNKCSNGYTYLPGIETSSGKRACHLLIYGSSVRCLCEVASVTCDFYARILYTKKD